MASLRDVSLAEAAKYGSLNDYAFFDKVSYKGNYFPLINEFVSFLCIITNILDGMHFSS
jgi:hypothetical protein